MTPDADPVEDWREHPERSAAGAVLGLVTSWALAFVVLGDWAVATGVGLEPPLTAGTMALVLLAPPVFLAAVCAPPTTRRWQGYFAPGLLAGVLLGYVVLAAVVAVAALV